MAIVITDDKHYRAIADVIREKNEGGDSFAPEYMAGAVAGACEYCRGLGRQAGYAEGKQAEYDRVWDSIQDSGNRRAYDFGFSGASWNDETFAPKYDIVATGDANNMFAVCKITDLSAALKKTGATLDVSAAKRCDAMFYYATKMTKVPGINVTGVTFSSGINNMFASCVALHTIEKLILTTDRYITANNSAFNSCRSLANITIEGTIGTSGWNFNACTPLTRASITSIVNALSTGTSSLTVTLPLAAVKREFETAPGANNGNTSAAWLALAGTRSNWTITLS
jgi:hypothetical protein